MCLCMCRCVCVSVYVYVFEALAVRHCSDIMMILCDDIQIITAVSNSTKIQIGSIFVSNSSKADVLCRCSFCW